MKKRIAILGSTGSIGCQALEVIASNENMFQIEVLTAQNNVELLIEQARRFNPDAVVISNEQHYNKLSEALKSSKIKVYTGEDALEQIVDSSSIDIVLTALVGFAGLKPTIRAIKANKIIALANKETLVAGGHLINKIVKENNSVIIPVDSEHSAIFQCLAGEGNNHIRKIVLTASGGPFRNKKISELKNVRKEQALKHPNWEMGSKITIDSASMMNKGLEVIEAKWLFGIDPDQIEVIIHPQSVIHSMVEFEDGSLKAQLGLPDMRLPIQYALSYPDRLKSDFEKFYISDFPVLSFEEVDLKKFRNLALAFEALKKQGNMPCILNAANEIAVALFLNDRIGFLDIPELVDQCMQKADFISEPDLDDLVYTNTETRKQALDIVNNNFRI